MAIQLTVWVYWKAINDDSWYVAFKILSANSKNSLPKENSTMPAETATADPLEEPPAMRSSATGLAGAPKCLFSPFILKTQFMEVKKEVNNKELSNR